MQGANESGSEMAEELFESGHLTYGWEPDLPVSDTLLRMGVFNLAELVAATIGSLGGSVERRPDLVVADLGRPAAFYNSCVLLQPPKPDEIGDLMQVLDRFYGFDEDRRGMVCLMSAWPLPDLSKFGWSLMGHPPLHVRPRGGSGPPDPVGVTISPVLSLHELLEWERCAIEAYPVEELLPVVPGSLMNQGSLDDERHQMWIARVDGRVAGVSGAFVAQGVNMVSLVATFPWARGRGIGTALTWRASLANDQYPAMLHSSDDGRSVYEKLGYLPISRWTFWYRTRP